MFTGKASDDTINQTSHLVANAQDLFSESDTVATEDTVLATLPSGDSERRRNGQSGEREGLRSQAGQESSPHQSKGRVVAASRRIGHALPKRFIPSSG